MTCKAALKEARDALDAINVSLLNSDIQDLTPQENTTLRWRNSAAIARIDQHLTSLEDKTCVTSNNHLSMMYAD